MSLTKVTYSMIDGNIVNVKDFGASTSDTVGTANLAAIQAAINTNLSVRFDELYTVNGPLLVNTRQRLFSENLGEKTAVLDYRLLYITLHIQKLVDWLKSKPQFIFLQQQALPE